MNDASKQLKKQNNKYKQWDEEMNTYFEKVTKEEFVEDSLKAGIVLQEKKHKRTM